MGGERSKAEIELAKCERYLQAILRTTADGFWEISPTGAIVDVNDAYTRMSGYSRLELLALAVTDVDALLKPQEIEARIRRITEQGSEIFQTRHRRKDGSFLDVEISATYLEEKDGRIICFCRDITDRKQTEAILAARLRLMEGSFSRSIAEIHQMTLDELELLTGSKIGFYHHYDEESRRFFLQAWSTATARDFCRARGSGLHYDLDKAGIWADCIRQRHAITHNDFAVLENKKGMPPGHAEVVRELVVPVIRKGKIVAVLGVGNKPTCYTDQDVEVVSTLADLSWDIAVRRMAEGELVLAKDAAEQASRAKSEFLANVSHEIRTPMTVILAVLEHLAPSFIEADQRVLMSLAETSAERLIKLIDDILDISRIEARRLDLEQKPFEIRDVVGEVLRLLSLQAGEKQIALHLHFSPLLPRWVMGDADRLGQVLINLVGNAIKFTNRGQITVDVAPATPETATIQFSVRDTGIGIPVAKQDFIFESFSQIDSSLTRKHGGTGLGLSIAKGLVELMGGKLGVSSQEGKGSLFFFQLPLPLPPENHSSAEPGRG